MRILYDSSQVSSPSTAQSATSVLVANSLTSSHAAGVPGGGGLEVGGGAGQHPHAALHATPAKVLGSHEHVMVASSIAAWHESPALMPSDVCDWTPRSPHGAEGGAAGDGGADGTGGDGGLGGEGQHPPDAGQYWWYEACAAAPTSYVLHALQSMLLRMPYTAKAAHPVWPPPEKVWRPA